MGRHVKNVQLPGVTTEIPSVTTANRPDGKNGQVIFNTTTSTFQAYIGATWNNISTAAGEKSESSHVMIIRMPRDAVKNNSISIVAKASLGNTTGSAVIYTKLENIDTGLSMEHENLSS